MNEIRKEKWGKFCQCIELIRVEKSVNFPELLVLIGEELEFAFSTVRYVRFSEIARLFTRKDAFELE